MSRHAWGAQAEEWESRGGRQERGREREMECRGERRRRERRGRRGRRA